MLEKVNFFLNILGIIKYGVIKGNKSAIFIAVKEGGDLALPKQAKYLTSIWLEKYINGNLF